MKIDFENFGCIDEGSIELNDFTLFCGKNNSGKTYAMYCLYGLLNKKFNISFDFVKSVVEKLKQDGIYHLEVADIIAQHQEEMAQHLQDRLKDYLPSLFSVGDSEFFNTTIRLHLDDVEMLKKAIEKRVDNSVSLRKPSISGPLSLWKAIDSGTIQITLSDTNMSDGFMQTYISDTLVEIIFFELSHQNSFLLPSERAGLNLFFKELFSVRNFMLQHAQNDNINPMEFLKDIIDSRYPAPIQDYLQFLSKVGHTQGSKCRFYEYAQVIEKNVLGGEYEVDDYGNVFFIPYQSKKLPLHFSSSTVKTLFGLVFYLKHFAKTDDYLMIDEPELNLHPDNQREVARVLAQLVNAGLKVIVSTHSDYFVRELNNLIMLKTDFTGASALQKKYGYQDNELLASKRVSAYLFDDKKITPMVLNEEGIIAETFNDVINKLNQSSNEIYYAMQDAKELESW